MRQALTVGVLGGLGPEATIDFMAKVLALTPARRDQDHLHLLVDSNPAVPNRNMALAGSGLSPVPELTAMARRLESAGADFLVMVCNTAHAYEREIAATVSIPFVSMVQATIETLGQQARGIRRAGILAADGCRRAGLYEQALRAADITPILSTEAEQERLMELIYAIKAGDTGPDIAGAMHDLATALLARGAEAVIAACTEVPLVLHAAALDRPFVDSTLALAEATVAIATRRRPLPV